MKKILKRKIVITFIICSVLFYSFGVSGVILYHARDFVYDNKDWEVSNVNDAIDDLYLMKDKLESIKLGDAKSSEIMINKKALVDGVKITGAVENKGDLNWTPNTSTTYTIPAGYYEGGTLDSSLTYQTGYEDGYSAGSQAGLNDLINAVFTVNLPMKNEFKNKSWDNSSSSGTTYTFTYNKGTISKPNASTGTRAKYGSQYYYMYCTNAVIQFISSKEFWVTFTIKGNLVVSWESANTTTYTVKYKWTNNKAAGTVSVSGSDISWGSGSYTMYLKLNGTPTVSVTA